MARKPIYADIGEVSQGTLRDEDLINSFVWELRRYARRLQMTREQRTRLTALLHECARRDGNLDRNSTYRGKLGGTRPDEDILADLFDALDELAPPHSYFGALEGDGACFGFWPIVDDDELPRIAAGDSVTDYRGQEIYIITDHGNVDCGYVDRRGTFCAFWSVV